MTCQHVREEIDISHGPDWSPLSHTSLSAITHHWKDKCSFSSNLIFFSWSSSVISFPWLSPPLFCLFFLLLLPLLPLAPLLAILKWTYSEGGKGRSRSTTESHQYIDAYFFFPGLILAAFWELTVIEHGRYSSLSFSSFSHLSIHAAILCRVISIILTLNWGIWGSERSDNMPTVTQLIISYFSYDLHP